MCINKNIKNIVKRLRILYNNMTIREVLRERGIVVSQISGSDISKGAYKMYDGIQYIFINKDLSSIQKLITLAHELGHSILHPDVDTYELKVSKQDYFLTKYENQADLFAAEFLLPDSIIDDICGCFCEVGDGKTTKSIADDYGFTEDLVLLKFNNSDKARIINSPYFHSDFYVQPCLFTEFNGNTIHREFK